MTWLLLWMLTMTTDAWDPLISPQARRVVTQEELNHWLMEEWLDGSISDDGTLTHIRGVEPTELW